MMNDLHQKVQASYLKRNAYRHRHGGQRQRRDAGRRAAARAGDDGLR
jgi:hypothetical protein